jgi:hypothetical protein
MSRRFLIPALFAATTLLAGCMSVPEGLDLALSKPTQDHKYVVDLRPLGDPNRINQMQSWEAHVTTTDGQPVSGARIEVGGGMPQHRHGLPTQPAVTRELDGGRYIIGGVKFSMTGWWELKLKIDSARAGADSATFNIVAGGSKAQARPAAPASLGKV